MSPYRVISSVHKVALSEEEISLEQSISKESTSMKAILLLRSPKTTYFS